MANPEHLTRLKERKDTWNQWRKDNTTVVPDLRGANLIWGNLSNLDLCGADLRDALLVRTDLRDTALRDADLSAADLTATHFINADLRGADLSEAVLFATTFATTRLNGARGLESCTHKAPSSIGIDTFFQSNAWLWRAGAVHRADEGPHRSDEPDPVLLVLYQLLQP
jgi:hypothetical protein